VKGAHTVGRERLKLEEGELLVTAVHFSYFSPLIPKMRGREGRQESEGWEPLPPPPLQC
jgi:hypothetical protein